MQITKEILEKQIDTFNTNEISKNLKISRGYVYVLCRKFNIKLKQRKPPHILDIHNQRFGFGVAIKETGKSNKKGRIWLLQCDCGNTYEGAIGDIKRNITSCGCEKKIHKNWSGFGEISGNYWSNISHSAKRRKIKFNITIEYIWGLFLKQNRKCALSELDISFGSRYDWKTITASLDRIDSSKGYIKGNVQWVHKYVNKMKMDLNEKEFINICKNIAQKFA